MAAWRGLTALAGAMSVLVLAGCTRRPPPLDGLWRSDPGALAESALAGGDSQFLFIQLPDSEVLAFRDLGFGMAMDLKRDVRWVPVESLTGGSRPDSALRDSLLDFATRYNERVLGARMERALCSGSAAGSTEPPEGACPDVGP